MQPTYERTNARYKGEIESEKYNKTFKQTEYNINKGCVMINDLQHLILETIATLLIENEDLKNKIRELEKKYEFILEQMEGR